MITQSIIIKEQDITNAKGKTKHEYLLFIDKKKVGRCTTDHISYMNGVWLHDIVIYKAYRSKGYGNILIQEVLKRVKEDFILLTVKKNNQIAINLYEKFGFKRLEDIFTNDPDYLYERKNVT